MEFLWRLYDGSNNYLLGRYIRINRLGDLELNLLSRLFKEQGNGNLWFFAILNTLTLLFGLLFWWVFNNHAWQEYWLVKATATNSLLGGVLIAYVVLIIAQVILGREPKAKTA